MRRMCILFSLVVLGAACGPSHIAPFVERHRDYRMGEYSAGSEPVSSGSLWPESGRGLFADFRASRVGDIVTVRVDENPNASGRASTQLERESEMSLGIPNFLGLASALASSYPDIDPSNLMRVISESAFDGSGSTRRATNLSAQRAVRVKATMPNGDFFVEGTKVLMVNEEELHLYISGVIRPTDIEADNSVRSSLIADAQVEFTGRGSLSDNQRQGWLARIINTITPF